MAVTALPQNLPAAKKRARGLVITSSTLRSARSLIWTACGYNILIAFMILALYPTLSLKSELINSYLTNGAVTGMLGSGSLKSLSGFAAFLGIYFYSSFNAILFGGIVAYLAGGALPRTIENGTLDLALARPISRSRYYLEILLAVLAASLLIALVTFVCAAVDILLTKNAQVDWLWLFFTQLIQLAFFLFCGSLGLLFGTFLNSSRAAGGAAVGIISLGYLLSIFGGLSNTLDWLSKITPFYYAQSLEPLVIHQITWWHPWLLVAVGLLLIIAGLFIFKRRDLPTV